MPPHYLLVFIVSNEKWAESSWDICACGDLLLCFFVDSLPLALNNLVVLCLGSDFFVLTLRGVCWSYKCIKWFSSSAGGSNISLPTFLSFPSGTVIMCNLLSLMAIEKSLKLCSPSFLPSFFPSFLTSFLPSSLLPPPSPPLPPPFSLSLSLFLVVLEFELGALLLESCLQLFLL
jgi:hypothetical protein